MNATVQQVDKKVNRLSGDLDLHKLEYKKDHEQYQKEMKEIGNKIAGIFRRLDAMSNRWLILSGSVIVTLLGICGWLINKLIELKAFGG